MIIRRNSRPLVTLPELLFHHLLVKNPYPLQLITYAVRLVSNLSATLYGTFIRFTMIPAISVVEPRAVAHSKAFKMLNLLWNYIFYRYNEQFVFEGSCPWNTILLHMIPPTFASPIITNKLIRPINFSGAFPFSKFLLVAFIKLKCPGALCIIAVKCVFFLVWLPLLLEFWSSIPLNIPIRQVAHSILPTGKFNYADQLIPYNFSNRDLPMFHGHVMALLRSEVSAILLGPL